MSKRLEAWCFKGADGWGHDICFQRGGGRAIRLGECAESETVVSRAELRALRAESAPLVVDDVLGKAGE